MPPRLRAACAREVCLVSAAGPGVPYVALTTIDDTGALALATASGVVKRVVPDSLQNKDAWEVIRLDEGDRVTKLIVTCRCGERIEILCAYAPGQR